MDRKKAYIAVFDSGVGGISVLKELVKLMPEENYLYFGDSANAPYGTKTREACMACVEQVMAHLLAQDVKAVVEAGLDAGVEWFIVEQDASPDRPALEAAKMSIDTLKKLGLKA